MCSYKNGSNYSSTFREYSRLKVLKREPMCMNDIKKIIKNEATGEF